MISSRSTWFYKWVFPMVFYGVLLFFLRGILEQGTFREMWAHFVGLTMLGVFATFLFMRGEWNLADSVVDHGAYLVVRRYGVEEVIAMERIEQVNYSGFGSPRRITLQLDSPAAFGGRISFLAKTSPYAPLFSTRCRIAEKLIQKSEAARARRAS